MDLAFIALGCPIGVGFLRRVCRQTSESQNAEPERRALIFRTGRCRHATFSNELGDLCGLVLLIVWKDDANLLWTAYWRIFQFCFFGIYAVEIEIF